MADVLALISFIEDGWFISSTRLPSKRSIDEVEGSGRLIDNDGCCPLAGACRSDVELDHSESVSDTSASESSNSRTKGDVEDLETEILSWTMSDMKRVFDTYDENGDGLICKTELENFMKKLDVNISEDELTIMIESADRNEDGYVDFEEFLELHKSIADRDVLPESDVEFVEEAELLEAFQVFDKNEDGFISAMELQTVIRSLGINPAMKVQDCEKIIHAVDKNSDGQVDFSEFRHLMVGICPPACRCVEVHVQIHKPIRQVELQ